MAKREKKPTVRPEIRRDWLRRYEQDGESPPAIADKDHYDVRTVRKQIDSARQEREQREAKVMVLRSALEQHYADLCKFAQDIGSGISGENPISQSLRDNPKWTALRQHLPRSPLWRNLDRWDQACEELEKSRVYVKPALEITIESHLNKRGELPSSAEWTVQGIVNWQIFRLEGMAKGQPDILVDNYMRTEPVSEGIVRVCCGAFNIVDVQRDQEGLVREIIKEIESTTASLEESTALQKYIGELKNLRSALKDELDVITLRRVVPGRCRYCPV
ncbi:hypothetical protein ACFLWB_02820 [Chloroflexota bacterium]